MKVFRESIFLGYLSLSALSPASKHHRKEQSHHGSDQCSRDRDAVK
jgi:hypothetical protein